MTELVQHSANWRYQTYMFMLWFGYIAHLVQWEGGILITHDDYYLSTRLLEVGRCDTLSCGSGSRYRKGGGGIWFGGWLVARESGCKFDLHTTIYKNSGKTKDLVVATRRGSPPPFL